MCYCLANAATFAGKSVLAGVGLIVVADCAGYFYNRYFNKKIDSPNCSKDIERGKGIEDLIKKDAA